MPPTPAIQCLGAFRVVDPDADRAVGRGLARELLGVLVARRGRPAATPELVERLWPGGAPATAATMVHGAVRRLRRALGDGALVTTDEGYALVEEVVAVDLWAIEDRVAGRAVAADGADGAAADVEPLFGPYVDRAWVAEVRDRLAVGPPAGEVPSTPSTSPRLVGRRRELAAVRDALGRSRLVSLVGIGGVGKTRVATEVVATLRQEGPLAVHRVDIGRGRGSVPARMLEVLGAIVPAGEGTGLDAALRALTALLEHTDLLLVDGAEHDLDGSADTIAHLLARLPRLRVVCSSRMSLGVPGEHVVPVLPFEAPGDPRGDAVELLLDRARALGLPPAEGDRERAAAICDRCAGVPLAIELAAAELMEVEPGEDRGGPGRSASDLAVRSAVYEALLAVSARARTLGRRMALLPAGVSPHLLAHLDRNGPGGAERELLAAGMVEVDVDRDGRRYHLPDTLRDVLLREATEGDVEVVAQALGELGTAALPRLGASPLVEHLVPALAEIPSSFAHLERLAPGARLDLAMRYRGAWGEDGHWGRGERTLLDALARVEADGPMDPVRRAEVVAAVFNISGSFEAHGRLLGLAAPAAEVAEAAGRLDLVVLLRYAQAAGAGYLGRVEEAIDAAVAVRAAADRSGEELLVLRADALDALGMVLTGRPGPARDALVAIADRCRELRLVGAAGRVRYTAATTARIAGDLERALADCRQAEEEAAAGLARANLAVIRAEIADLGRVLGADERAQRAAYQAAVEAATAAGQLRIAGHARLRLGVAEASTATIARACLELLVGDHQLASVGLVRLADLLGPTHPIAARLPALLDALAGGPGVPLGGDDAALVAARRRGSAPAGEPAGGAGLLVDLEVELEALAALGVD